MLDYTYSSALVSCWSSSMGWSFSSLVIAEAQDLDVTRRLGSDSVDSDGGGMAGHLQPLEMRVFWAFQIVVDLQ